jgi:hypothetical protein
MKPLRAAVLIGLTAAVLFGKDARWKLWDLDLSKFANGDKELAALVWGIGISPDESKVAIGFGPNWSHDTRTRHVVVVDFPHPATALNSFSLDLLMGEFPHGIVWSPSGEPVAIRTNERRPFVFRLDGAPPCSFPDGMSFGGFLSGDRVLILQ